MRTILCLSIAATVAAQAPVVNAPATGFLDKTIALAGREHRYVVYVPREFRPGLRWPLIMFLNGMGECGTDGRKQVEVGLGNAITKSPDRWPFFVVFPQKPDKTSQWLEHDALVMAVLAATEKEYPIDCTRRFLTGLSQGGAGTWAIGAKHAGVWKAIAPVCGYGRPDEVAAKLETTPIWAFHGVDDKAVPVQQSKDLCAAVAQAGGRPHLTLYENTAHNSWDKAYGDSALAEWLRLIVSEPVLARALAAADRLQGSLTIHRVMESPAGERSTEPFSAATEIVVTERGARCVSSRTGVEPRTHAMSPEEGRRQLAQYLGTLCRAGLFELRPMEESLLTDSQFLLVEITIDGQRGGYQVCLPPAAATAKNVSARTALAGVDAALRRLAERR